MVNCALLISIAQWTMDIFDLKNVCKKINKWQKLYFPNSMEKEVDMPYKCFILVLFSISFGKKYIVNSNFDFKNCIDKFYL